MGEDPSRRPSLPSEDRDSGGPPPRHLPRNATLDYADGKPRRPSEAFGGPGRQTLRGPGAQSDVVPSARRGRLPASIPPENDVRTRAYRAVRHDGLLDALEQHIGWMNDDQRGDFKSALSHGELARAHDILSILVERYPKNITIKKTLAIFRSQVILRYEEALGGLHVVPRKARSFISLRLGDREKFADLVDGVTPIEGILRASKQDRLRGLETLAAWFKNGSIEIIEPQGSHAAAADPTPAAPVVYERPRVIESRPPPPASGLPRRGISYSLADRETDELPARASRAPAGSARQSLGAGLRSLSVRPEAKPTPPAFPALAEVARLPSEPPDSGRPTVVDPIETEAQLRRAKILSDPSVPAVLMGFELDGASEKVESRAVQEHAEETGPASEPPPLGSDRPVTVATAAEAHVSEPSPAAPPEPTAGRFEPNEKANRAREAEPDASSTTPEPRPWLGRVGPIHAVAGGVVVALVAIGIYKLTRDDAPAPPPPAAMTEGPAPAPTQAAEIKPTVVVPPLVPRPLERPATSAAPAASAANEITLKLDVEPKFAKIYVDGEALPPKTFERTLPRDGKMHEVRVESVGYRKLKKKFKADADTTLVVVLEVIPVKAKEPATAKPSAPQPPPTAAEPPATAIYD